MAQDEHSEYHKVPTKEVINNETSKIPTSYAYGVRHIQSVLMFLSIMVAFMARAHLGVTVVAMTSTNKSAVNDNNTFVNNTNNNVNLGIDIKKITYTGDRNVTSETEFEVNDTFTKEEKVDVDSIWNVYRTYEWTKPIQEMILDSFFLGYSLMMFPMGMVCQRYGGKIPLQICFLVNGLITILTPSLAAWGDWKAVCCCRLLQGMSQSGMYPSTHTLLARWVPVSERATFISYVYTGSTIGTVISFQVGGFLAYSTAGWPSAFWLVGTTCLITFVLVTVFVAASPLEHETISEEEKNFILGRVDDGIQRRPKTPWKEILSSKPVWAAVTSHVFCGICFVFLFTQIPTYIHYMLGFDIKNSGLLSSLPFIGSFFSSIAFGLMSDYFTNKGILTLKMARITSNSLAQIGPAVCLVAVSFTENRAFAVFLLVVAMALYAGVHTGWMVNYIDLSSNFSGSIMALGNTAAALGTLSQPFLVSNIVTNVSDRSQWRIMLFLMATMITLSNIFYVCFMSTDSQSWNEVKDSDVTETEKQKTPKAETNE